MCVVTLEAVPTVTELPVEGVLAAWSPDGSRIVTGNTGLRDPNRSGKPVVSTMAPDGSDVRVLVWQDVEGGFLSADDLRQAALAARPAEIVACDAGTAVPKPETNPNLVRDCETLLRVRDALHGTDELDWAPNFPIGRWDGLHVGGWPQRIFEIHLNGHD